MIEKITIGSFRTNTYIISNNYNECVIIDPTLDFFYTAKKIKEKYRVAAILLTHGHLDHIDGARYFDAPIYIYRDELDFLSNDKLSLYYQFNTVMPSFSNKVILIDDNFEFEIIGLKFKVYHTPGHTSGSVVYLLENNLFTGDTLFNLGIGRFDFPTGSYEKIIESINKICNIFNDDIIIYPGHGNTTNIGFEKRNNPYLN